MSGAVGTNGDEVVTLDAVDLAPELKVLKAHRFLKNVKSKLNLKAFINIEGA